MPIALALPAVWKMALYAGSSLLAIAASYFLSKFIAKWMNEYKAVENQIKVTSAKTQVQTVTQVADAESDALKKLDGR